MRLLCQSQKTLLLTAEPAARMSVYYISFPSEHQVPRGDVDRSRWMPVHAVSCMIKRRTDLEEPVIYRKQ